MRSAGTSPRHAAHPVKRGFSGPKVRLAHAAVYAVGADHHVGFGRGAVLEARDHALALLLDADQTVAGMRALPGQRRSQQRCEIAAMEMIVGRAERRLDLRSQRSALQGAAVVPAPLMHAGRPYAPRIHRVLEAETMQQPRRIGADLDAGADLAESRRRFVHMDVATRLQHRERSREPADTAANHCHLQTHGAKNRGERTTSDGEGSICERGSSRAVRP